MSINLPAGTVNKDDFILVKTLLPRLPLPLNAERPSVTTERLLIRALVPEDVDAMHVLRTQPEVMQYTMRGRPDETLDDTWAAFNRSLPPNDATTFNYAICLRETGEFIGIGGWHNLVSTFGWPEVGYMFMKETWGRGYATEFLRAWLGVYERLPREEVEVWVDRRTVVVGEGGMAREVLIAVTADTNERSHGVLRKCGFQGILVWETEDNRDGRSGEVVRLPVFGKFWGLE